MTEKIENINILLTERTMPSKGGTSSNAINDTIKELSHDLVGIQDQWNNRLVPLTTGLPAGSPSGEIDAFINGLDGANCYVDADATAIYRASYYAVSPGRPNTIYEQFESIYTSLTTLEESLENQLNDLARTASQVSITDTANIYTASNVETALAEIMVKVNSISLATLGAVNQNIIPLIDNTYTIGSAVKRWKDGYFGPSSLHVVATAGEAGGVAKDYKLAVDPTTGYLLLKDSSTTLAILGANDFSFGNGTGAPRVSINGAAGQDRGIYFQTNSLKRWGLDIESTAEGENDAGSNFELVRWDDLGATPFVPLSVSRANGVLTLSCSPAAAVGMETCLYLHPTISQSGTAGYNGLHIDITEASIGGGLRYPLKITAGEEILRVDNNGRLALSDGNASSPSVTFINNSSAGMFRPNVNQLGFTVSGVEELRIQHNFVEVQKDLAVIGQLYSPNFQQYVPEEIANINWDDGNIQYVSLNDALGNITLTFSNPKSGATYTLIIVQAVAGGIDIIWPANVLWKNATVPVISAGSNAIDKVILLYETGYYFAEIGQNYSL